MRYLTKSFSKVENTSSLSHRVAYQLKGNLAAPVAFKSSSRAVNLNYGMTYWACSQQVKMNRARNKRRAWIV
jgi:hypothetical protein